MHYILLFIFIALINTTYGSAEADATSAEGAARGRSTFPLPSATDTEVIRWGYGQLRTRFPFPDQSRGEVIDLGPQFRKIVGDDGAVCCVTNPSITPQDVLETFFLSEEAPRGHMDCLTSAQAVQFLLLAHKIGFDSLDRAYEWMGENVRVAVGAGSTPVQVVRNLHFGSRRGNIVGVPFAQDIFFQCLDIKDGVIRGFSVGAIVCFANHPSYYRVKPTGALGAENCVLLEDAASEGVFIGHGSLFIEKPERPAEEIRTIMAEDFKGALIPQVAAVVTPKVVKVARARVISLEKVDWIRKKLGSLS